MNNRHLHSTVHSTNHDGIKRIFLIVATTAILWFVPPCQAKPKEVQLGCATPQFAHIFDNPLKALTTAITEDTKSARFRVTWNSSLGSFWDEGTMLYDRQRSLLKYYQIGGSGEAGERFYRKNYVFTGIGDATLVNIVKIYNNQQNIRKLYPSSFIHLLPKHGYRRYKFADKEVMKQTKR